MTRFTNMLFARISATALLAVSALVLAVSAGPSRAQDTGKLAFEVLRDGKPFGTHEIRFTRGAENDLDVDIAIDLAVELGPFTVFEYTHRNETRWRDGRLTSMRARTDDNGDRFEVQVDEAGDALRISASGMETTTVARDILPTTYWMASTVEQSELINTQNGEISNVTIQEAGRETVSGPDGPIPATRYRMTGDVRVDLWYDDTGILVGLAFTARGSQVTYRLTEQLQPLPVADAAPGLTARRQAATR